MTTRVRNIPTEVRLGDAHGLPQACVANFDNIAPLPETALARWAGRLTSEELRQPAPPHASPPDC